MFHLTIIQKQFFFSSNKNIQQIFQNKFHCHRFIFKIDWSHANWPKKTHFLFLLWNFILELDLVFIYRTELLRQVYVQKKIYGKNFISNICDSMGFLVGWRRVLSSVFFSLNSVSWKDFMTDISISDKKKSFVRFLWSVVCVYHET